MFKIKDGKIFTSCATEGEIKVFEVREKQLFCIFASENVHLLDGKPTSLRHVRSLAVIGDNVCYGDDGVNLKILSWKKGKYKKGELFSNYLSPSGLYMTLKKKAFKNIVGKGESAHSQLFFQQCFQLTSRHVFF